MNDRINKTLADMETRLQRLEEWGDGDVATIFADISLRLRKLESLTVATCGQDDYPGDMTIEEQIAYQRELCDLLHEYTSRTCSVDLTCNKDLTCADHQD